MQALAAFGLQPEKPLPVAELDIWPENWTPFQLFRRMLTQLILGPTGAVVGIRYESMPFVMRAMDIARSDWQNTFDAFQAMERHMLRTIANKG